MGIIIAIAVISGLITLINVLGSIALASEGKAPQLGGEVALIFVLIMWHMFTWYIALALFFVIVFMWAFVLGIYDKNK